MIEGGLGFVGGGGNVYMCVCVYRVCVYGVYVCVCERERCVCV